MFTLGVDVSKWQVGFNWNTCAKTSAKFAFVRAGSVDNPSGKCYVDYEFYRNSTQAPEFLLTGYYWYFRPNWSTRMQADFFSNLIYDAKRQLLPVIDVEAPPDTFGVQITKQQYADRITEFVLTLIKNLSIPRVIIYTRQSYWDYYVEGRTLWSKQDLWAARYATGLSSPWSDGKYVFRDWKTWTFWQFTSNGVGELYGTNPQVSKDIDLDYFNGSYDELKMYAGVPVVSQTDLWMTEIDAWARTQGYTGIKPFGE